MVKIAPSIASGPQTNLTETIIALEKAGADIIHFDIEDGHFVPTITIGIKMIKELRSITALPFDVHLMIDNPESFIPNIVEYGADMISVHFEACPYPRRTLGMIHKLGIKAGLALNAKTSLPDIRHYAEYLSYMLVLTTEPEYEKCAYLPNVLDKVREGKLDDAFDGIQWEVDGGFTPENIQDAITAGADIVVSGRGVFLGGDINNNVLKMKKVEFK